MMFEKIKKFFLGAFDYEQPSAGCGSSGIEAEPGMKRKYKNV